MGDGTCAMKVASAHTTSSQSRKKSGRPRVMGVGENESTQVKAMHDNSSAQRAREREGMRGYERVVPGTRWGRGSRVYSVGACVQIQKRVRGGTSSKRQRELAGALAAHLARGG